MKTLVIRALSAAVAVIAVGLIIYFYDVNGLKFLCAVVSILASRELARMLFPDGSSLLIKLGFEILSLLTFATAVLIPLHSTLAFACISICFFSLSIFHFRKLENLAELLLFMGKGVLGLLYVGWMPAMAYRILEIPHGKIWFITMLAVVFMGDTFAYLCGMLWGNKKLLPTISPKKTIVGSFGGLLGSSLAGLISGLYLLPQVSLFGLIFLSILTGIFAQFGDLFESLLKRVAQRKDSGTLMPGHGGVLDRIDGVLFGAPILLAGALLLQPLFDAI